MQDKVKNWEELCNDGDNYGGEGQNLSPKEKILFENIKDKKVLKIQDAYLFSKTGKIEEDDLNYGMKKVKFIFTLGKGSYATLAIKKIITLE